MTREELIQYHYRADGQSSDKVIRVGLIGKPGFDQDDACDRMIWVAHYERRDTKKYWIFTYDEQYHTYPHIGHLNNRCKGVVLRFLAAWLQDARDAGLEVIEL